MNDNLDDHAPCGCFWVGMDAIDHSKCIAPDLIRTVDLLLAEQHLLEDDEWEFIHATIAKAHPDREVT